MKFSNHHEKLLERGLNQIRHEEIDPATVRMSAERVLATLRQESQAENTALPTAQSSQVSAQISGCTDFQALIPAYLNRELSGARALLVEDHTRECVPCRRMLRQLREERSAAAVKTNSLASENSAEKSFAAKLAALTAGQRKALSWAVAAVLIVGLGLLSVPIIERVFYSVRVLNSVVQASNGAVYRVTENDSSTVANGEQIAKGEKLRTARDAGAIVQIPDGSTLEMRERSEFWLSEDARGTTIHLERGSVIVQAAKQKAGKHLYVVTPDSQVSVVGTIFSVNSGTKGSRVSVLEGEVRVSSEGREWTLHPGDQVSTSASVERVAIQDEISWSQQADRYRQLLAELKNAAKQLDNTSRPGLRYSTQLLDLVPENVVFYAAIPNISRTLSEANTLIQQRLAQNPTLSDWWAKEGHAKEINEAVTHIQEFGSYFGDEVVISSALNVSNRLDDPLILAELNDAAAFRNYLEGKLANKKGNRGVRFINDPSQLSALSARDQRNFLIWIHHNLMIASPDAQSLQMMAARVKSPSRANASAFHHTLAGLYREGAGLIVAADLEKLIGSAMTESAKTERGSREHAAASQLGLTNFQHFVAELKEKDGKPYNRAMVTFREANRGIASWLAAPGPMGALEYVSPDASVATAFVVKKPSQMVEDIFAALSTVNEQFTQQLAQFEAQHGVSIRQDLAEPLGGEFAFAIDGPMLPFPSWKLVFEVYDQARLQQSIEKLTAELNTWAATQGKKGVNFEKSEQSGRVFHTIKSLDYGLEFNYTFVNGYLVAAPSRALVDRALKYRESQYSLVRSAKFRAALPEDGNANFSALVYNNLSSVVAPAARQLGGFADKLPEEQKQMMKAMGENTPAMLGYVYAYGDRVVFSLNTENGPLGLTPGSLLNLPGSFLFGEMMHGKKNH